MERITWSKKDKIEVAELSFKIRQNPDSAISDIECVRRAMEMLLPLEKHRKLTQMQQVQFVKDAWPKLMRNLALTDTPAGVYDPAMQIKEIDKQIADSKIEHTHAPVYGTTQQWPRAINPVAPPQHEAQIQKKPTLEDLTTEMLAQELVSRLLKAVDTSTLKALIRDEVNAVLDRRLPGILAPDEPVEVEAAKAEPVAPKHKVCVLGLMSKQQHIMREEYKGLIDFHFMEGNEGGTRVKKTAELMDLTIKTNWAHRSMPSMKGVSNFVHADGMTSIRNLIAGRFGIKSTAKAA
jgi:hypothetical protein